jgi:hypothetical protein
MERLAPWRGPVMADAGGAIGVRSWWPRGSGMSCRRGSQPVEVPYAEVLVVDSTALRRRGHHRSIAQGESRGQC